MRVQQGGLGAGRQGPEGRTRGGRIARHLPGIRPRPAVERLQHPEAQPGVAARVVGREQRQRRVQQVQRLQPPRLLRRAGAEVRIHLGRPAPAAAPHRAATR